MSFTNAGPSAQQTTNTQISTTGSGVASVGGTTFANLPANTAAGATAFTSDGFSAISNGKGWSKQTTQLLTKIRAGIAAAAVGNPVESLPLSPPISMSGGSAARANATAYTQGFVCTNAAATHMFVCQTGGTSAGAEPGAMTTALVTTVPYNMGAIVDNTVTWYWLGPTRVTVAQPGAPTITVGTLPAQLSTRKDFSPQVSLSAPNPQFRFTGGTGANAGFSTTNITFWRGRTQSGTNGNFSPTNFLNSGFCNAVDFVTDSNYFALDLSGNNGSITATDQFAMEIDGRRFSDGPLVSLSTVGTPNGYIIIDFRTAGARRLRRIRLSTNRVSATAFPQIGSLRMAPQDQIVFHANPNRYRIAYIGDSITEGSNSGPFMSRWDRASIMADLVGCDDVSNLGAGGTGFVAGSPVTYVQRIQDIQITQPDVVWICGAFNDTAGASLQAAALAYLQAIRLAVPNAMIILAGTAGALTIGNLTAIDAYLQNAVTQFADTSTFFVPVSTDTNGAWITGTQAIQGAPAGTGNSEIYVGTTDTTHPSALGVVYLAARDAMAFKNLIASL